MVCIKNLALSTALLLSAAESTLAAPTAYDGLALRGETGVETDLETRQFGAIAGVFKNIGKGNGAKGAKHNNKKDKTGTVVGYKGGKKIIGGVLGRDLDLETRQFGAIANVFKNIGKGNGAKGAKHNNKKDKTGTVVGYKDGKKIIGGVLGRDLDLETRQFGAIANVFKNIGKGNGAKGAKHNNKKDKTGTVVGYKDGKKIIGGVLGRDLEEREEASDADFVERDESEDLGERDFEFDDLYERDFDIEDLLERDLESDDLVERELELDDLVVRHSELEDLDERDLELDDLVERDFELEDLLERDFESEELAERDFEFEDLYE